jgi:SAM-dependent methyltransferase
MTEPMTEPQMTRGNRVSHGTDAEFDAFAHDYDRHMAKGLALAGESKEHFARARVEWTRVRLAEWGHHATTALDFGCGTGTSTPMLKEILGLDSVLGVDVSRRSLELAPTGPGLSYGLVEETSPSGMDLAFTNGVFHHIGPEDRPESVRYLHDALRPHGVLALWENSPFNPGTRYGMRTNAFDRDAVMVRPGQIRSLLRTGGFRVLRTDFTFIFPHALRALRWTEPHLARFPIGGQYVVFAQKL